ncbi:ankyrin repeat-containing protein [Heterostelium album PN500]|uniref:Ankyrin repeat-containing protein n=1 Tax=Heterostelium pallidum (strain ATCC 26659 / Pp 5 / PN500) TaxID=670386 RepID=D3AX42_HETP5|nr:ankyrin repeat-containing protein [Heterostelium album PN500]EFA86111.1 ankyrin repeat-containing protein [Heterostelium album PN500]|eukprot:XP_020438216.1 ankyrin repeat-containing protein [Heterostelium album PN500]
MGNLLSLFRSSYFNQDDFTMTGLESFPSNVVSKSIANHAYLMIYTSASDSDTTLVGHFAVVLDINGETTDTDNPKGLMIHMVLVEKGISQNVCCVANRYNKQQPSSTLNRVVHLGKVSREMENPFEWRVWALNVFSSFIKDNCNVCAQRSYNNSNNSNSTVDNNESFVVIKAKNNAENKEVKITQILSSNSNSNSNNNDSTTTIASPSPSSTSPNIISSSTEFQQLLDAIKFDRIDALDRLIQKNRDLLVQTDDVGRTPLYIAIEDHCSLEIKSILIQYSDIDKLNTLLTINSPTTVVNNNNNNTTPAATTTPATATSTTTTTVVSLESYQFPASQENVLHCAVRNGDSELVTLLLAKSPDLKDSVDSLKRSPVILAAANGRMECIRLLILNSADVNKVDYNNKTALHLAIDLNHSDIASTIVNNNGDHTVLFHYRPHRAQVNDIIEIGHGKENVMDIIPKLDRYGRIIDNENPNQFDVHERKRVELELSRAQKWCIMMKRWLPDGKRPSKVKERTIKGIPDRVRSQAWRLLSQSDIQLQKQPKLFKDLIETPSKSEQCIYLDVNRASRDYIFFREKYGYGQVALFDVLKAYSLFDQDIGYTQGMSSIAALLVMYLPEEEAFWTFERLMNKEEYAMRNLFVPGLIKLHEMIYVFDNLIAKYYPALSNHPLILIIVYYKLQNEINLGSVLFATKWFITGFLDSLPFYLILRIWDLIFSLGFNIVYSVALTLLRILEKQLVGKTLEECFNTFQHMSEMNINDDLFVTNVMNRIYQMNNPIEQALKSKKEYLDGTPEDRIKMIAKVNDSPKLFTLNYLASKGLPFDELLLEVLTEPSIEKTNSKKKMDRKDLKRKSTSSKLRSHSDEKHQIEKKQKSNHDEEIVDNVTEISATLNHGESQGVSEYQSESNGIALETPEEYKLSGITKVKNRAEPTYDILPKTLRYMDIDNWSINAGLAMVKLLTPRFEALLRDKSGEKDFIMKIMKTQDLE